MTASTILLIILIIYSVDFAFERFLGYLNTTQWSNIIPKELQGIYDEKEYQRQQDYSKVNHRFGRYIAYLTFVIMVGILYFGGFGWLDSYVYDSITQNAILQALVFFAIIGVLSDLLGMPFEWYATFHIEERFGFNKMTPKTFFMDKVKGWLLGALIGGGLIALIIFIYTRMPDYFWLVAWGVIALFSILMSMFYTSLILPLFNKQEPLGDGSLRDKIEAFSNKIDFKLDNIYVMDGSKRSTKGNAFFSGLGPRKRIVLYDTLIKDLTEEEIVAVLAHEVGHQKKKHILQGTVLSLLSTGLMFYILSLFLGNEDLCKALGAERASFHIAILAFGILYTPISFFLGIVMSQFSRKNEYEADAYAKEYYDAAPLMSGLKKLSVKSLSNLKPHPFYVFCYFSHPTLLQRIKIVA
jgi:STE24 endopeptidase